MLLLRTTPITPSIHILMNSFSLYWIQIVYDFNLFSENMLAILFVYFRSIKIYSIRFSCHFQHFFKSVYRVCMMICMYCVLTIILRIQIWDTNNSYNACLLWKQYIISKGCVVLKPSIILYAISSTLNQLNDMKHASQKQKKKIFCTEIFKKNEIC